MTSARYVDPSSAETLSAPVPDEDEASAAAAVNFVELFRDFGAYVPGLLRRLGVLSGGR